MNAALKTVALLLGFVGLALVGAGPKKEPQAVEPVAALKPAPETPVVIADEAELPAPTLNLVSLQFTSTKEQQYLDQIADLEITISGLKAEIEKLKAPKPTTMVSVPVVRYTQPTTTYYYQPTCGPNGCGQSQGSVRRGFFGRR